MSDQDILQACRGSQVWVGSPPFTLDLKWSCDDSDRTHVWCEVSSPDAPGRSFKRFLTPDEPTLEFALGGQYGARGSVFTEYGEDDVRLWGRFSVGTQLDVNGIVATWSVEVGPYPPPPPPPEPDEGLSAGVVIRNPRPAKEILNLVWIRPATISPESPLDFVVVTNPSSLPLVQGLASLRSKPDAWSTMRAENAAFIEDSEDFVPDVAALGAPVSSFGALYEDLAALEGTVVLDEITAIIDASLKASIKMTLAQYLSSSIFQTAYSRLWQSLIAVAGSDPGQYAIADSYVPVTALWGFMDRVVAGDARLEDPALRSRALNAWAALPDVVAPGDPSTEAVGSEGLAEGGTPTPAVTVGWARALGIGELRPVRRRLLRYVPGEIAGVTNLLPGERRQMTDRGLTRTETGGLDELVSQQGEISSVAEISRSDLLSEAMDGGCEGDVALTFQDLNLSYGSSGLTVDVTGGANLAGVLASGQKVDVSRYVQGITERAAERVEDRVRKFRTTAHVAERERIEIRKIDNRRDTDTVAIYRWLLAVYEYWLDRDEDRLIVEFLIDEPASEYLAAIERDDGVALTPPPTLRSLGVKEPTDLGADNYRTLGAWYELRNLPPPPATTRTVGSTLQNTPPRSAALVEVPKGYQAKSFRGSYVTSDGTAPMLGFVAGATFASEAASPEAPDASDPPPVPGSGTFGPTPLDTEERSISVAVYSAAASYTVVVELDCESLGSAEDLAAWQITTYQALTEAYDRLQAEYLRRRRVRIAASSEGRTREVEREALQDKAQALLLELYERTRPTPSDQPGILRFLSRALVWKKMAYTFYTWGVGEPPSTYEPCWPAETLIRPESDAFFEKFLRAGSARVLVAVKPPYFGAMLNYLLYGRLWPCAARYTPVTDTASHWIEDLVGPCPAEPGSSWQVEVPSCLLYLQEGRTLPTYTSGVSPADPEKG